MKEDTKPTWKEVNGGYAKDMTLRQHIAIEVMKAMLGPFLLKELDEVDPDGWMDGIAMDAYAMADAMLDAVEDEMDTYKKMFKDSEK